MLRFVTIADTHLGASPMGYQQQKGYPERLREIVSALRAFVEDAGDIGFVLHAGDMLDATRDAGILEAAELFDLPVPVYLCLGNHDLTVSSALQRWLELAPEFFPGRTPEYTLKTKEALIHVIPNQWQDRPYHWEGAQMPHFSDEQLRFAGEALSVQPELPHVLVTHSPVHGLPRGQTGMDDPLHSPPASFTASIETLAERHPNLVCVIGAHNHMNMCIATRGVRYVTASALVETPFEFKVFTVNSGVVSMETFSLAHALGGRGEYNAARASVQGRPEDRAFTR